jgi:ATP-binding cassette subfamily C protein CydC
MKKRMVLMRLLLLIKPYGLLMLAAALCGAATIAANIGLLAAAAVLISQAALMPPILYLMPLIVGVRFFGMARAVLRYGERYVGHDVTFRILKQLRVWFYRRLEPLAPANLQDRSSAGLFKEMVNDIETLKYFYLRVLAAPLIALLVFTASSIFLYLYSPGAAVILGLFFLLSGLVIPVVVRYFTRNLAAQQSALLEAGHIKMLDFIQGLDILQAYQGDRKLRSECERLYQSLSQKRYQIQAWENFTGAVIQYFSHIALLAGIFVSIPLVAAGRLEGIYLAMIGLVMWTAFEAVQPLPLALTQLDEGLEAAGRLMALTASPPEFWKPDEPEKVMPVITKPPEIVFKRVSFSYGASDLRALQDISFCLPPASKTALIGPNGAGKSTIINLLLKFWDAEQGQICWDGMDLQTIDDITVRNCLGVLDQTPYIFHASIRENILLAHSQATEEELQEACRQAKLHDFICSLPQGYDTQVGEKGFKLSGGQRQRLAWARVYLKNSPVLVLDEPNQGLDMLTSQEIRESLREWAHNKTVLIITHSLLGLEEMDNIILMDEGRILAQGNHEELIRTCDLYAKMLTLEKARI